MRCYARNRILLLWAWAGATTIIFSMLQGRVHSFAHPPLHQAMLQNRQHHTKNIQVCVVEPTTPRRAKTIRKHPFKQPIKKGVLVLWASQAGGSDPWADETPEEREERMRLVRQIQQTYYQSSSSEQSSSISTSRDDDDDDDDASGSPNEISSVLDSGGESSSSSAGATRILHNIPLFRVQWTELPGFQNVLNIHVPHYTHMFRCVLAQAHQDDDDDDDDLPHRKHYKYLFGHVHLPGGSENLSNPDYDLNDPSGAATRMGTLMQISDVLERPDGTMALIVQGVARIQILNATQTAPYAAATVQLVPDDEEEDDPKNNNNNGDDDGTDADWKDFEFRPTTWDDMALQGGGGGGGVSPLVNFNSQYFPDEMQLGAEKVDDDDDDDDDCLEEEEELIQLEYDLWIAIDDMLRLLSEATGGAQVPVPSQLLGLLLPPSCLRTIMIDAEDNNSNSNNNWPDTFRLEGFAQKLWQCNAAIGTGSKSPFVRVPDSYPTIRRARRLSFAVWILLDSLLPLIGSNDNTAGGGSSSSGEGNKKDDRSLRQRVLEMTSIADRLSYAQQQVEMINRRLRKP
jgi:hypothetical protein